jgi:hypothetical protein
MKKAFLVVVALYGLAWYQGWSLADLNVPGMVTDRSNCEKSYPDVCISPPPPYLTCDELSVTRFKVFGDDPHGFDPDKDGLGCD